jgi:apolipoprotein D and lipocalin family protein
MQMIQTVVVAGLALGTWACSTTAPLATVEQIDLPRFMGDWYVLGHIPTSIERNAYNAIEGYQLDPDGTIATRFTFREGGFDGEQREYRPRGFVREGTGNAVWGMRFIWPFKAEYRVAYVDSGYTVTIIGRTKRDYVWIMARNPAIPAQQYEDMVQRVAGMGYDVSDLRQVPQQW